VVALIEPEFDELAGRTLGVWGAGTIGRGVMAIGEAFGMRVIGLTSRSCETDQEQALPNLLLTPPVAWISRQAWERLVQALTEHLRAYAAERGKGGG